MPNGVRNGIWALFFVSGMAFMAFLVFMLWPALRDEVSVREKPGSTILLGGSSKNGTIRKRPIHIIEVADDHRNLQAKVSSAKPTELTPTDSNEGSRRIDSSQIDPNEIVGSASLRTSESSPCPMLSTISVVQPGRRIFGHVSLIGKLPQPKTLEVGNGYCGPNTVSTTLTSRVYTRAADNSVADVIVATTAGLPDELAAKTAAPSWITMNQCRFEPYITAIQLGQRVAIKNLDDVFESVTVRSEQFGFSPKFLAFAHEGGCPKFTA